jgi:dihydrofolate synthase/folylpolyglutamate synthase
MDFEDALAYLQGRLRLGVKLGNDRFEALLERLGSPHQSLRVVHIAGTKGKGSTTAFAAGILQAAGLKTGIYLSPYVYDVRERIQVDGHMISKDDFGRLVGEIQPHVEALEETNLGATTEFELKTAIGLLHFAQQNVDAAVIEVGLGGRLDATNVVRNPLVTAITNIGYDHVEMLGPTLGHIAREKAGIVKPGVPCVTAVPLGSEAGVEIEAICRERSAPLVPVQDHAGSAASCWFESLKDNEVRIHTSKRDITARLGLHGRFQHANAAVAVAALDAISSRVLPDLSSETVMEGLAATTLPGRFQQVAANPVVVVDVAHNELSAAALADALREEYSAHTKQLTLVVGLSKNHDPEPFLKPLIALNAQTLIATQPGFRPRDAREVAAVARDLGFPDVRICPDSVVSALQEAIRSVPAPDIICLTGSFYTVGDAPPDRIAELIRERKS